MHATGHQSCVANEREVMSHFGHVTPQYADCFRARSSFWLPVSASCPSIFPGPRSVRSVFVFVDALMNFALLTVPLAEIALQQRPNQ